MSLLRYFQRSSVPLPDPCGRLSAEIPRAATEEANEAVESARREVAKLVYDATISIKIFPGGP